MTAATKPKRPKVRHQVWVTFTVFVKRDGDKHPWYRHGRGPNLDVEGVGHYQAFQLGERELARLLAEQVAEAAS